MLCANGTRRASLSRSSGNVLLSPLPNHIQKVFGYQWDTEEKLGSRNHGKEKVAELHTPVWSSCTPLWADCKLVYDVRKKVYKTKKSRKSCTIAAQH